MTNHRLFYVLLLNFDDTQEQRILLRISVFSNNKMIHPHHKIVMSLLIMFVTMHYSNFLNFSLMNFHDNYHRQIVFNTRLISLLVIKSLHESFIDNQQMNSLKQNDKFMGIFKLDIFDHQIALLALQYYS